MYISTYLFDVRYSPEVPKNFLQDMKKTQRENIFNQASFPLKVWELAVEVMDKFEQRALKSSKGTMKNEPSEFKQYHLAPLHHLPESFQVTETGKTAFRLQVSCLNITIILHIFPTIPTG